MGAALIEKSDYCRQIVGRLEARLAKLPEKDRPGWSLIQELLEAPATRIKKASISQPLCTALQIIQVELLRCADVEFSAVVGHSSGEIAAAYCAGVITPDEAICIAYYRGLISERASSSRRKCGAMIAVATTLSDAQELCEDEDFENRVCLAAINSPTSVTLSGDSDAIEQMRTILKDEGKLVRDLQVDQAYHSFHMERCAEEYVHALEALNIEPKRVKTPWFSSVDSGREVGTDQLSRIRSSYWSENMVQPVTFMQAIDQAWKSQGPFDMAVELGPHPALKRPALDTIQELHGQKIPYTGVHARGRDAIESFAGALGLLWSNVASANLSSYDKHVTGQVDSVPVTELPPYAWDHQKQYWHESRYAKSIRTRSGPAHELLGHLTPDSSDKDMRWRNVLCPNEIPWLKNHAIENQAVFPAAGYVVVAVEATAAMAKRNGLAISLIEVRDLDIGKALAFDSDDARMEIVVTLNSIQQLNNVINASFNFHAAPALSDGSLNLLASGSITATLGDGDPNALPSRGYSQADLSKIDYDDFYESLSSLGYEYAEQFRALRGLKRKFGFASGSIEVETSAMLIHPAVLDASFQSIFLANCAPNSGGIWSLHVPKTIHVVRVNPFLCAASTASKEPVSFDCIQPKDTSGFECDIDIFARVSDVEQGMIQVQGLCCVPLTRPTAADDKEMFATTAWDVAAPEGNLVAFDGEPTVEKTQLASLLERMSVFYLRRLSTSVSEQHPSRWTDPYKHYFKFASHILSQAEDGKIPYWSSEWANDSYEDLRVAYEPFLTFPDVRLLQAVGDSIVDIATGKVQAIEIGMRNDMLARVYEFGLGFQEYSIFLGRIVKQIVHRHPSMKILEVGAGTGVATKRVFSEIGNRFSSYTFTDISSGFFERAQDLFSSHRSTMLYKVLDISRDVSSQGVDEHSYDMVIASAVLHASKSCNSNILCLKNKKTNIL
jgi:hybrid polyketide synthase/nonribosomal peptide synthetase ACE1